MFPKGVSKGLKGHLLQAKRALVECRFIVFTKLLGENFGQIGVFISLGVIRFTICL